MSGRNEKLLRDVAALFEDGRTFDHSFLVEHNVSIDELDGLLMSLSAAIRVYLILPGPFRNEFLARALVRDLAYEGTEAAS